MFYPTAKRVLAVLVVALVLAAPCGSASAAPAATAEGDLPVAAEYWHRSPTNCTMVAFSASPRPGFGGFATQPRLSGPARPCVLEIHEVEAGTGYTPEYVCLIAVHEWGHLLGQRHSRDPSSIMWWSAPLPPVVPQCVAG